MNLNLSPSELANTQVTLLGCMLIDERTVGPILAETKPEEYTLEVYRTVYLAIRAQFSGGKPVDVVTLLATLGGDKAEQNRWATLLKQAMEITPTAANWRVYADLLHEQYRLHELNRLGAALTEATTTADALAAVDEINSKCATRPGTKVTTMAEGLAEFLADTQKAPKHFRWGFDALDSKLYVGPGKFVVLGGYPSHGKTALALQTAWTQAQTARVGFFSLETDRNTLMARLVARLCRLDMGKIKRHELSEGDYESIAAVSERVSKSKLEIIEAAGFTVGDIFSTALSRRYELIYIDYLGLIRPGRRRNSRYEEVTEISQGLANNARSTGISVVALSQLSRPEKGEKVPRMRNLRDSGQVEQDADVIMLLYRTDASDLQNPGRELAVEKNKEGEVGTLHLELDGPTQTFRHVVNWTPPKKIRQPPMETVSEKDGPDIEDCPQVSFEELPADGNYKMPF